MPDIEEFACLCEKLFVLRNFLLRVIELWQNLCLPVIKTKTGISILHSGGSQAIDAEYTFFIRNSQFWHFLGEASSFLTKNSNIGKVLHPLPYLMLLNCSSDQQLSFSEMIDAKLPIF